MDWSPPRKPAPRPAGFIEPCIPTLAEKPPAGPAWIHEIKHDGFRLLVWRDGERVRLFTRRGFDWTDRYPHALSGLGATLLPMPAEPRPRCRCVEEEHRGRWQPIRQRRSVACPLVLLAVSSVRIRWSLWPSDRWARNRDSASVPGPSTTSRARPRSSSGSFMTPLTNRPPSRARSRNIRCHQMRAAGSLRIGGGIERWPDAERFVNLS